jgi:hypothetical protein
MRGLIGTGKAAGRPRLKGGKKMGKTAINMLVAWLFAVALCLNGCGGGGGTDSPGNTIGSNTSSIPATTAYKATVYLERTGVQSVLTDEYLRSGYPDIADPQFGEPTVFTYTKSSYPTDYIERLCSGNTSATLGLIVKKIDDETYDVALQPYTTQSGSPDRHYLSTCSDPCRVSKGGTKTVSGRLEYGSFPCYRIGMMYEYYRMKVTVEPL